MATTVKKRYDTPVTIRIPEPVRRGVRKLAEDTGETVTGVILGHLRPFELYTTEEGQEALRHFEEVVASSTAIHKAPPTYHDSEGKVGHPPVETWHGFELRNYGTTSHPLFLHLVRQREGQTRAEAVKGYALDLWREWSLLETPAERGAFVDSLEGNSHLFVLGYVGFSKWKSFPSTYEASRHRELATQAPEPQSPEELRFYAWSVAWLTELWNTATHKNHVWRPGEGTELILHEVELQQPAKGASFTEVLSHYEDISQAENIQRWARHLLRKAKESKQEDFETLQNITRSCGYKVRFLTIDT